MERIFASSIITQELINNQFNLAIEYNKNKRKFKQVKLNASKLRTAEKIIT
mgnify:CR=1 FL=1|tara:strand:+ start:245 stop:397 length:153 start_codon:yes stop_codon:yes gene_type:complete